MYPHRGAFSGSISIHSPHTRGDVVCNALRNYLDISIHSPHTRGDGAAGEGERPDAFQSTPLIRGETPTTARVTKSIPISIHSPHTRGDAARPL